MVGDYQESALLKEYDFLAIAGLTKSSKTRLYDLDVGDEVLDHLGPSLIEGFVPDGGREYFLDEHFAIGSVEDIVFFLLDDEILFGILDFIDFMNQDKDCGFHGEFSQIFNCASVIT